MLPLIEVKLEPTHIISGQVGRFHMLEDALKSTLDEKSFLLFLYLLDNMNKVTSHRELKLSLNLPDFYEKKCVQILERKNMLKYESILTGKNPIDRYTIQGRKHWLLSE